MNFDTREELNVQYDENFDYISGTLLSINMRSDGNTQIHLI